MDSEEFSEVLKGGTAVDFLDNYEEIGRHGNTVIGRLVRHGQVWFVKSYSQTEDNEEYALRLRKEYEVLLKLNHPGIVRVGWLEELPEAGMSLIMELVEGETLDLYLEHAEQSERKVIADALLDVVAYMHSQGVCHLDLKPQNIMVAGRGRNIRLKICDFGMSDWSGSAMFKNSGGTRGFSDPAQFNIGYKSTPRSDVYSLGCLLKLINCGGDYRRAAISAMSLRMEERPADASALIEMLRSVRWKRRVIYSLVGLLVVVAIISGMLALGGRSNEDMGELADTIMVKTEVADSLPGSVVERCDDFEPQTEKEVQKAFALKEEFGAETNVDEKDSVEKEYAEMVRQWNEELAGRARKMIEIAECDTLSRKERRSLIGQMGDEMIEDTEEFFLPFVKRTGKESRPLTWGTIYDPAFKEVRIRMTRVYESLRD